MNTVLGALTSHGLQQAAITAQQAAQNKATAAYLEPVPPAPLLVSVIERLRGAHDVADRLERLAERVFGAVPTNGVGGVDPEPSHSAMVDTLLSALLDRLHSVTNRLEQIG